MDRNGNSLWYFGTHRDAELKPPPKPHRRMPEELQDLAMRLEIAAPELHKRRHRLQERVMKRIVAGVLEVAYLEAGPSDGAPVILLHGFPYDAHAYDAVAELLAANGRRCIIPFLRGYGSTRFLAAETPRSGQQAALGADLLALMDALAIPSAVLAGYDWGGRAACIVAALWPQRARGLVSSGSGYNIQNIAGALFRSRRRPSIASGISTTSTRNAAAPASPPIGARYAGCSGGCGRRHGAFDDATFARSAGAFDNPDFVDVVIHSYRHRFGGIAGDPALDAIEARLASSPA